MPDPERPPDAVADICTYCGAEYPTDLHMVNCAMTADMDAWLDEEAHGLHD